MIKEKYRYPGIQPYGSSDSDIFFGRDEDSSRLHDLIMIEKLVVLFGRSGYGKSSLIKAGLLPQLFNANREERFKYHPLEIRLGLSTEQSESPIKKVISKLNEQFGDSNEYTLFDDGLGPTLWTSFKRKQAKEHNKFLLIFDQFEEFFTYPEEEQQAFRWQLAELLFTLVPQRFHFRADAANEDERNMLAIPLNVKVLFSIRSDRLSLLHSMKDALPGIFNCRFEILGLQPQQAREVIVNPPAIPDEDFITPMFSYEDEAVVHMLEELAIKQNDGSVSVEPFQLQIICQACEHKIFDMFMEGRLNLEIKKEDLPEFNNLYEKSYLDQLQKLPEDVRDAAQLLMEEDLVIEDSMAREYRRLSIDGDILKRKLQSLGVDAQVLDLMENTFLVRRELNTVGGVSYEIPHDKLIGPIVKFKNLRQERIRLDVRLEAQRKKQREEYRIRRKRAFRHRLMAYGLIMTILIAAWFFRERWYYYYLTISDKTERPVIYSKDKLKDILTVLNVRLSADAQKITGDGEKGLGPWAASQVAAGLYGLAHDSIAKDFFYLTTHTMADTTCCCWKEEKIYKDLRASGWVVSSIGMLHLTNKYNCNVLEFFLNAQMNNGAWCMIEMDKDLIEYSSTYSTCHAIRALYNSMDKVKDPRLKDRIRRSIGAGISWLIRSMDSSATPTWRDYPLDRSYGSIRSVSLSGLAIHTLNMMGVASPDLNKRWLAGLEKSQLAKIDIDDVERTDKLYILDGNKGAATYRDPTRHMIIPWEIIATVDAYRYGNVQERLNANVWLDNVVKRINLVELSDLAPFITAEVFISLRYLHDVNYQFK